MRWSVLLLVGCGRVAFDASGDAAAPDAFACVAPVGHDEDGDGIDDACDGCPHIAEDTPMDSDGDGVGDVCDPQPAVAAERIVFFETFAGSLDPRWSIVGSTPTFEGDRILFTTGTGAVTMRIAQPPARDVYALAGHAITGDPTGNRQVTISAVQGDGPASYYCELLTRGGGTRKFGITTTLDGMTFTNAGSQPVDTDLEAADFDVTMVHDTTLECLTTFAPGVAIQATRPTEITPSVIGIRLNGLAAYLDYFIQIRSE